jgi:ribosomal protein L11 methyltransferase
MPWVQLHLTSDRDTAPVLEDRLLACGALSVTLADSEDEPILEPGVGETPLWQSVRITGLFEADIDRRTVTSAIADIAGTRAADPVWETLADRPWERTWMDDFAPIRCGDRLWICPSWQSPPDPGAVNLVLDPGLAFGSGTHATTFLCLQWLDGQDLAGKTVIDYGCGSGILGIGALLLGADRVIAVDNDPQALLATRDNLHRNGLDTDRLTAWLPDQMPTATVDILVANILAGPLIELSALLEGRLKAGGRLCLSGITGEQTEAVVGAYPGIHFDSPVCRDEWTRLTGVKTGT